jgi:hypothetical protein
MLNRQMNIVASVFLIPVILTCPAFGQPTVTGYAQLTSPVDELIERQSLGLEAIYFGGQGLQDSARTSITPYGFFGGYGSDGIMTGAGISVETDALLPVGVGLGFGLTDADFLTWALSLDAHKQFRTTPWSGLLVQGVFGYQRLTEGRSDYYAIWLDYAEWPDTPEGQVLLEDLGWYTFYVHAVFEARWRFVKPLLDIGWRGSSYSYNGYECEIDCFDPGAGTSGDGSVTGGTVGLGLSLDAGALQAFGGLKWTDGSAIFPVSLTIVF